MIYPNPSDEVLRSAHLVTLYDPRVPDWTLILADGTRDGVHNGHLWNVVDIPVDSTNTSAVERWRDVVEQARK